MCAFPCYSQRVTRSYGYGYSLWSCSLGSRSLGSCSCQLSWEAAGFPPWLFKRGITLRVKVLYRTNGKHRKEPAVRYSATLYGGRGARVVSIRAASAPDPVGVTATTRPHSSVQPHKPLLMSLVFKHDTKYSYGTDHRLAQSARQHTKRVCVLNCAILSRRRVVPRPLAFAVACLGAWPHVSSACRLVPQTVTSVPTGQWQTWTWTHSGMPAQR